MNTHDHAVRDLLTFLEASREETRRAVVALSAAESLTDEVAKRLAITAGLKSDYAERLIRALHFSDFVTERNSEWHFAARVHPVLNERLRDDTKLYIATHTLLAELASEPDLFDTGEEIPAYLLSGVGAAYHQSALSSQQGLELYVNASRNELSGTQWLLGRLAIEQQEQGILPPTAIEPPYLRGMTLYREGRIKEAEPLLRRVADSQQIREEVAIACHLVGRIDSRTSSTWDRAEDLLRRSLAILEKRNDRYGQAQVLFTLGKLLWENNSGEAKRMLLRSIELNRQLGIKWAEQMVQRALRRLEEDKQ